MNLPEGLSWPAIVSVVGSGRGSGKTTVANALLAAGLQNKRRLGVISVGKGGHNTPLRLSKGTLVALAKNCELTHRLELREELDANTPWGEILIGRIRQASEAVIAGPITLHDTIEAAQRLVTEGAELIVVDGSFGRLSASDSHLAQCFILAIGADPADRWARKEQLERLHSIALMPKGHWVVPSPSAPQKQGQPAYWQKDHWVFFSELEQLPNADLSAAEVLYWPGALTDRTTQLLDRFPSPLALLLDQPWHLLCSQERWQALWRGGWSFFARAKATLAWVAVNPHALDGHMESPEGLLKDAGAAFQTVECRQLQ